jgi:hypothetical protein
VDWKYSFATEGISGSERVTRAQVRFIYLCGARKVIVICAKFILASGTFDTVSYIAQSICVVLQISLRVPKIHEFYCQTAAFILGFQNAAVHITFRPATSRAVRSISRGSSPQSGTDLFRLRMNRADGKNRALILKK